MFSFLDFCLNEKNFEKSLLLCERLKNILNYQVLKFTNKKENDD